MFSDRNDKLKLPKSRLDKNLKLAEKAIKYVLDKNIQSATSPNVTADKGSDIYSEIMGIRENRARQFSPKECLRELLAIPNDVKFRLFKRNIRGIKESQYIDPEDNKSYRVGNCEEYANLALNYLRKQNVNYAEIVRIKDGDHVFVVIDRDPKSDINKPETWGENAVICDAHSNDRYTVSEIYDKLKWHLYDRADHKQPNKYLPYTAKKTLEVINVISSERNENQQETLISEFQDKLKLIQHIEEKYFGKENSDSKSYLYGEVEQIKSEAGSKNWSNIEVERKLNGLIRKETSVSLPRYKFWDIPVPRIHSPTRQVCLRRPWTSCVRSFLIPLRGSKIALPH